VAIGTGSLCVGIALSGGIAVHGRLNVVDVYVFCVNGSVCAVDACLVPTFSIGFMYCFTFNFYVILIQFAVYCRWDKFRVFVKCTGVVSLCGGN
jgi:hypothetical protein